MLSKVQLVIIHSVMPSHSTFILLDDMILVIGNSQSEVVVLIANLNTTFALKDLGEINYFFGIQVKNMVEEFHSTNQVYLRFVE